MKRSFAIIFLVSIISLFYCSGENNESIAQDTKQHVASKESEENSWVSFDKGMQLLADQKKPMLVDFYTDWCHWCKVMDEKTFHESKVAEKLKKDFITVRLNAESTTEKATFKGQTLTNRELTQAFRVTGFPSLAFISPEQEIITVIPGYVPADQFINILEYIGQECYKKKVSFEDFLKQKGECDKETTDKKSS